MSLEVLTTGPLATVQDLGRPGHAGIGVGTSGAADVPSLKLANRLVGNDEGAAAIEVTFGGLALRATRDLTVALTGAPCPITVAGREGAPNSVLHVARGAELRLGVPAVGLRSYLAVRGGIDVEPVLGSRSTDVLSGLGPEALQPCAVLPVGPPPSRFPVVDLAPVAGPPDDVVLRVRPGPRDDWFTADALKTLVSAPYEVTAESNRVGMRLDGPVLERSCTEELPSEGMVTGALQVPPVGTPTLFLADHPVTGGYPVIGVVVSADVRRAAQARPGQRVHFRYE
ncbi:biotin-dependent carboxyltransferase [Saccharopolyspora rhizosphaerae]|uniref:Biotin-dependent carboxyltransferase n=1 Tax=Saccharopolyspora rhizosphaerae TaxID=2492662 RepID=A0A3R8NZM3_9PSEU|nr:biotin-dependent carboxyltransferase family protein [Saccharopolyspora rhizosphaerae]RRO16723.1 biotin-dependent carboxyltransferase [Saccharopolyspora rhizosphaerae]